MQLQRQQPTYARLRRSLREGLTEPEIRAQYPKMAADLVDKLLLDVRTAHDLDAFVDEFASESAVNIIGGASNARAGRTDDDECVDNQAEAGTLTEQAQKLRRDTLRRQLDDLTRVWPVLQ